MTIGRIQQIMSTVAGATAGIGNADGWREQLAYLQSGVGAAYYKALTDGVNAYKKSPRRSEAATIS
jgi:hypothetical protein